MKREILEVTCDICDKVFVPKDNKGVVFKVGRAEVRLCDSELLSDSVFSVLKDICPNCEGIINNAFNTASRKIYDLRLGFGGFTNGVSKD